MRHLLALCLTALILSACTTSPTTGKPIFTGMVSAEKESALGAQQHPAILKEYGGVSDNAELNAYVASIGARLAPYAERKDVQWRFTVLDSDVINAFALPGGYVYVTRGLMALAQDESQVAAVLGHEMGHVNARHSAQQMSQGMLAQIGLSVLGAAVGSTAVNQAGSIGTDLVMKSYSRGDEFEADTQGVKYLVAAGYDPYAEAKFLQMLQRHGALEAQMRGTETGGEMFSYFSTHPQTPERVARATAMADAAAKNANAIVGRDTYLRAINGTAYGSGGKQGYVRGTTFTHPVLGIAFTAPDGFKISNGEKQVVAKNKEGAAMVFDMGASRDDIGNDAGAYLSTIWAKDSPLSQQERLNINGMDAATAVTQANTSQGEMNARLIALSAGNGKFYRLVFLTPQGQDARYATAFRQATYSFKKIPAENVAQPRVRVTSVRNGDTVASLAQTMSVEDFAVERFCLLNGITPQTQLQPGTRIKIVATR